MKKEPKFYLGDACDHIVELIRGGKKDEVFCCGEKLSPMIAQTSKEIEEKHLPVVQKNDTHIQVGVGRVMHPMTDEHSIGFIYLQTKMGAQRIDLEKQKEPVAEFWISPKDKAIAVYAFCNQHGFWKTDLT